MNIEHFKSIKDTIMSDATAQQLLELEDVVKQVIARQFTAVALAKRTASVTDARICPRCGSNDVVLHGKDKLQRQKFKCRGCKRTYNILTGTPIARARMPEKWSTYLGFMTEHKSVRKILVAGIGVHQITVWRWRHRFLQAAARDNASVLSGIVEADETFLLRSYKGSRGWKRGKPPENRAARPRAWGAIKRGLSHEQVPVLTAVDTSNGIYETILASLSDIPRALEGIIAPGSVLCSDGHSGYIRVASHAKAERYVIEVPTTTLLSVKLNPVPTPARSGRLGLGRVNAHHERMKTFINRQCNGVATKYLENYLGWHRAMRKFGFEGKALLERALVKI